MIATVAVAINRAFLCDLKNEESVGGSLGLLGGPAGVGSTPEPVDDVGSIGDVGPGDVGTVGSPGLPPGLVDPNPTVHSKASKVVQLGCGVNMRYGKLAISLHIPQNGPNVWISFLSP